MNFTDFCRLLFADTREARLEKAVSEIRDVVANMDCYGGYAFKGVVPSPDPCDCDVCKLKQILTEIEE